MSKIGQYYFELTQLNPEQKYMDYDDGSETFFGPDETDTQKTHTEFDDIPF